MSKMRKKEKMEEKTKGLISKKTHATQILFLWMNHMFDCVYYESNIEFFQEKSLCFGYNLKCSVFTWDH